MFSKIGSNVTSDNDIMNGVILYKNKAKVNVGELYRYVIHYTPPLEQDNQINRPISYRSSLWLKITNLEALPLRAAYLAGPYLLYVDVTPDDYDQNCKIYSTADQPTYEPQLKPGQSFYAQLYMNKVRKSYSWTVDVISQIIFSSNASVQFQIAVAASKEDLIHVNNATIIPSTTKTGLWVQRHDTLDIWNSPIPRHDSPVHLVVLTHGLHSNVGSDMLYVKEKIDEMARKSNENVIVRGYFDNVCKTEKGIKFLGKRLGDYIMNELVPKKPKDINPPVRKISFIGHSLGGLVQTFAIAYIQTMDPEFFTRVEPINFICLATPFLGLSNENPGYIKFALDIGFAGKTGQDLGLTRKPTTKKTTPLLQNLPTGPTQKALSKFKHRTLYANSVNDGIVPLRTSALLYLDWKGLIRAAKAKRGEKPLGAESSQEYDERQQSGEQDEEEDNGKHGDTTSQIPEEDEAMDDKSHEEGFMKSLRKPSELLNTHVRTPLLSVFSFLAPQASGKPDKIYRRSQTVNNDDAESDDEEKKNRGEHLPKKTSMIESGVSVLLPPLPSQRFIMDPSTRPHAIFHDRVYHEQDLPTRRYNHRPPNFIKRVRTIGSSESSVDSETPTAISSNSTSNIDPAADSQVVEKAKIEERIAREWHHGISWRKVLVMLEPDAHNNIIVRRRFANAYGWPIIDHLVESHFDHIKPPKTPGLAKVRPIDILKNTSWLLNAHGQPSEEELKRLDEEFSQDLCVRDGELVTPTGSPISPLDCGLSSSQAWERHIRTYDDNDSEDDGLVYSVGSWIDNLRDIGNFNLNAFMDVSGPNEVVKEPGEEFSMLQDTLEGNEIH